MKFSIILKLAIDDTEIYRFVATIYVYIHYEIKYYLESA